MNTVESITLFGVIFIFLGVIINSIVILKIARNQEAEKYNKVALEKRLEIHQEAFRRCREILKGANPEKHGEYFNDYQDWWNRNCLYLGSKSRKSFLSMYFKLLLYQVNDNSQDIIREKKEFGDLINKTIKYLTEEIGLPWLKEDKLEIEE